MKLLVKAYLWYYDMILSIDNKQEESFIRFKFFTCIMAKFNDTDERLRRNISLGYCLYSKEVVSTYTHNKVVIAGLFQFLTSD